MQVIIVKNKKPYQNDRIQLAKQTASHAVDNDKNKTFEDMVRRCTSTTYRRTTIAAIVYKTNQKKKY